MDVKTEIVTRTMDSVLLDLERARMEREDFKQGNAPTSAISVGGVWSATTWRYWNKRHVAELNEANDALSNIRTELRDMDGRVPMDIADNVTQIRAEVDALLGDEESGEEQ